jgi:hypothetical protein
MDAEYLKLREPKGHDDMVAKADITDVGGIKSILKNVAKVKPNGSADS